MDCGGGGGRPSPPPPPPPPPPPQGGGGGSASCSGAVVLYEHTNFQGRCWGFPAGQTDWIGDAANDQASSIWVADGYVATIFLHAWFGGPSHNTHTTSDPWSWADIGNDNVSSLVVQSAEPDWNCYYGNEETQGPTAWGSVSDACERLLQSRRKRYPTWPPWKAMGVRARHELLLERQHRVVDLVARGRGLVDPIPFPLNLIQGWRYSPVSFQPGEAGYPSAVLRADGKFEFCGFKYGCITSSQPWVRIELRANGSALCSTNYRTSPFACKRY